MTTINGIELPCFGTLKEIHAALVKDLNWIDERVIINGYGYIVKEAGFQSNDTGRVYTPEQFAELLHPGTAILIGIIEDGTENGHMQIVTSGKVKHVSKRCALCGMQLDQEGIKHGACGACYAEEVGH